jgi:ribosomal 30S subunit maturation factor RimM
MSEQDRTNHERDFVGLSLHDEDCERIGEVIGVFTDSVTTASYLIVDRPLIPDLAIPVGVVTRAGDGLLVPFTGLHVDRAPEVDLKDGVLSAPDQRRIDNFFLRRAA